MVLRGGVDVTKEYSQRGRRGKKRAEFRPRKDEIITPEMADPNKVNAGYVVAEGHVENARTSGVYWNNTRARGGGLPSGLSKKTLLDRASNPSSTRGEAASGTGNQVRQSGEEEDFLHLDPG